VRDFQHVWGRFSRRAVAIILLAVVPPAFATFPGSNGRIAYTVSSGLSNTGNPLASIVFTDLGKLTLAPAGVSESYPAWSPDGSQLAFVRQDTSTSRFTIEIIRRDGTGERTVIGTEVFGTGNSGNLLFPAWSADGHSISFIRNDLSCLPPYYCGKNRLYTINTDLPV
jgi:Tol biopolymer transport system component